MLAPIRVEQFEKVLNQFLINDQINNIVYFQSYNQVVCEYSFSTKTLTCYGSPFQWGKTTSKYFKRFVELKTYLDYEKIKKEDKKIKEHDTIRSWR